MTVAQRILQHLRSLPESKQAQVLDFVEYLEAKARARDREQEDADWSAFSLSEAIRGMESEDPPYSTKDLKEVFP